MNIPAIMLTGALIASPSFALGAVEEGYLCGRCVISYEEGNRKWDYPLEGTLDDFLYDNCLEHWGRNLYVDIGVRAVPAEDGLELYFDDDRNVFISKYPATMPINKTVTEEGSYRILARMDRNNLMLTPVMLCNKNREYLWATEEGKAVALKVNQFFNNK